MFSLFDDAVSNQIGRQKMPIKLMSSGNSSLNSNTNIENKIYLCMILEIVLM